MKYLPTIGLEIHVELKTKTKMFCGCKNDSLETKPNTNVCPICLGHPGTLPVPNIEAVKSVLKLGLALQADLAEKSKFDRKSYFIRFKLIRYQISQYDEPLVRNGELLGVRVKRIHLEEDVGRLLHEIPALSRSHGAKDDERLKTSDKATYVDFNRAGVPLMELVTEPDIKSGEQAVAFAKMLRLILRYLRISDADMEKGQMRVEANISVRPEGQDEFGTKVEVKNLNSFKSVGDAVNFEIRRQTEALESGGKVFQETRGWDQNKKATFSQRSKEEAKDYRYFPEPDIPSIDLQETSLINLEELRRAIPELPLEKKSRLMKEYGLVEVQADLMIEDGDLADFFEETISEAEGDDDIDSSEKQRFTELAFNYLTSDLKGFMNSQGIGFEELKISPENLADLADLIFNGEITSRVAKDLIPEMQKTGLDPRQIVKEKGLEQVSDEEIIEQAVNKVVAENPGAVADYKAGKKTALQFLIGKTMAELKGKGHPGKIGEKLEKQL
ncbi:MAG: Asp-tRNA(Asn)/Glu-tRNA(Gln) amidotransferase subunit GatB [Patescibacteria group bacterium]|nr:Asp-tRNA(Asn)/Glu-tRNA(Gln) amidotransferase subunit GatB [Patescibacteria group bacterium]